MLDRTIFLALQGLGVPVWSWPAPRDRSYPLVTFRRMRHTYDYNAIDGKRDVSDVPYQIAVWARSDDDWDRQLEIVQAIVDAIDAIAAGPQLAAARVRGLFHDYDGANDLRGIVCDVDFATGEI